MPEGKVTRKGDRKLAEASAETDLQKTIEYIAEKEKNLSHYSDKLREGVERIMNVFGGSEICQICYGHKDSASHMGTGSHSFVASIELSNDYDDSETFYSLPRNGDKQGVHYRLAIRDHDCVVVKSYGCEDGRSFWCNDLKRETLKHLVKSGRLPTFFQKLGKAVAAKENEYRKVAAVAEKLAAAL